MNQSNGQQNDAEDISQNRLLHAQRLLRNIENDDLASHLAEGLAAGAVHVNLVNQKRARVDDVGQNPKWNGRRKPKNEHQSRIPAHLPVWPQIQQSNSFVPGEPYLRTVSNVGVGPALIRSVQVSVDGVPRRTWAEVVQALFGKPAPGHVYSSLRAGAVVLTEVDRGMSL